MLQVLAADTRHLGARIGATLVLHTWGSALTHNPHVHGIMPGGGLAPDGKTWVACRPGFFLPVRVLSRLFRRRFLEELGELHRAGRLQFFGERAALQHTKAFADWLAPMHQQKWLAALAHFLTPPCYLNTARGRACRRHASSCGSVTSTSVVKCNLYGLHACKVNFITLSAPRVRGRTATQQSLTTKAANR